MGVVMEPRWAWSVGVLTVSPHGQSLTSIFVVAPSRAEAIAAGVRHAIERTACPDHDANCPAAVAMAVAQMIDGDVVREAARVLEKTDL